jgi:hypothetical protein
MAMKPRMAPTTMKTVPSGRWDTCMYGAPAVGGTEGAAIVNAPAMVGRSEGMALLMPVWPEPVIVGAAPVKTPEEPPVMCAVVVCIEVPVFASVVDAVFADFVLAVLLLVAVASAEDADCTREEMSGTPVSVLLPCADAIARSPAPAKRSGMRVEIFIVCCDVVAAAFVNAEPSLLWTPLKTTRRLPE